MNKKRPPYQFPLFFGLGVFLFLAMWWILSAALASQGSSIVLNPWETFLSMGELLFGNAAPITWSAIGWTLLRLIIGFAISFVLAMGLGTLGALFSKLEDTLKPFIVFFKTIPTAAIVLILGALWIVPGKLAYADYIPSVLTFFVAFPILYEAFVKGIREEEAEVLDALALESGRRSLKSVVFVLWPDAFPYISLGIAQSLGLSLKVTIMSEVLSANSATHYGIGSLIMECQTNPMLKVESILPYSVIALLLMFVLDIPMFVIKHKSKRKGNRR